MTKYFCDWCERQTNPGNLYLIRWEIIGAAIKPISERGDRPPHDKHDPTIALYSADICPDCKATVDLPEREANAMEWLAGRGIAMKEKALAEMARIESAEATK